jgi:hypothetical protein
VIDLTGDVEKHGRYNNLGDGVTELRGEAGIAVAVEDCSVSTLPSVFT